MAASTRARKAGAPTKLSMFEVDKEGLAKLLARRGPQFAVAELVQNAWDEDSRTVKVKLEPAGEGHYWLTVEDDNPEGFSDLTHAYTLFAESAKKGDVTKRGRFNLGEKLVIAVCEWAEINTTKGRIVFADGGREMHPPTLKRGSQFVGRLPMTEAEAEDARRLIFSLIPPADITTTFNGEVLPEREAVGQVEVSLRTEKADEDGNLRPTSRKTAVRIYEPLAGEKPMLYEMGIPVVELGDDRWHVDIAQKVPLNMDRDGVPPFYLRDVRAAVLNYAANRLSGEEARARWVTDAISDERAEPEAVRHIVTERFGRAVLADPTDREAEKMAVQQGYTVVTGGALPREAWAQVRAAEAIKPAGQVTPSPRPNEGDDEINVMDPAHWPTPVKLIAGYAQRVAQEVIGVEITVRIANAPQWPFAATYGSKRLTLNLGTLGYRWFDQGVTDEVNALLIHEFAHEKVSDHLSRAFYDECCLLGARLARAYAEQRLAGTPDEDGIAPRGEVG